MGRLFQELRRRNMFRVAGVYAVIGWLLIQIGVAVLPTFEAPPWVLKVFIALIFGGLPISLILAWAFEMTPEGMKLTVAVPKGESIAPKTSRKLDYVIIGGLALVGFMIIADRLMPETVVTAAPQISQDEDGVSAASIAVLPFADLSPGGDQEYFSDGMAEEILNVLVKVTGLNVASRTSSFQFKNRDLGIPKIAHELKVRHVLEGSVRKSGDAIRVTAQLIDADTDEHLWSETFDRMLTAENVFAIQEEIAQSIVTALSSRIDGATFSDPIHVSADTKSVATLDLYYEANALFLERGRNNLTRAMALFEEMTARDPDFARGWSGLSMVYVVADAWGLPPRDYETLTRDAAAKAIALNPKLSSPYAALGQVEQNAENLNWTAAKNNYDKALSIDDRDPNIYNWRALLWEETGFADRALADFDTCLEIDPAYVNCGFNKSDVLYVLGRQDEAIAVDQELMRRGATDQLWGSARIQHLVTKGDRFGALAALNWMMLTTMPDQRWIVGELDSAYFDPAYDQSRFEHILARLAEDGYENLDEATHDTIAIALRRYDQAIFTAVHPHFVGFYPEYTKDDYRRLVQRKGVQKFWRAHGFPPLCKPVGADDFECDRAK